jgi:hypothetical protein
MIALAIICLASGLLILPIFKPFLQGAANVLLLGNSYKDVVFGALR